MTHCRSMVMKMHNCPIHGETSNDKCPSCGDFPPMTLRDHYAMAALPALISGTKQSDLPQDARGSLEILGKHLAKMTFAIADAMMEER